jgi:hypothetical protein
MPISENNGLSGDVRLDIGKSLDRVEAAGSYATFGQLDYFTDPEVYVGGKRISTPLSENDAQRIIRASHQAPFGKGSETIVDTSVRKTWELNGKDFELRNPAWKSYLDDVLQRVTMQLGLVSNRGTVKAELYKMLLYEKGAMFNLTQTPRKSPACSPLWSSACHQHTQVERLSSGTENQVGGFGPKL